MSFKCLLNGVEIPLSAWIVVGHGDGVRHRRPERHWWRRPGLHRRIGLAERAQNSCTQSYRVISTISYTICNRKYIIRCHI